MRTVIPSFATSDSVSVAKKYYHTLYTVVYDVNFSFTSFYHHVLLNASTAKLVTDKTYTLCGTPNYVSPEMILDNGHCAGVDHWALGILIYEMVAGENPFYYDGMQFTELYRCICEEDFHPLPKTASDEVCELVEGLLQKDPLVRLGSRSRRGKDIMAKNWFDGLDLDDLRIKKYEAPFIPNNDMMDDLIEEICSDEPKPRAART